MKKIIGSILLGCSVMGIICSSCSQSVEDEPAEITAAIEDKFTSELSDVLEKAISESVGRQQDAYVVYDAESDEYVTMTQDEYNLAVAFSALVVRDDDSVENSYDGVIRKAPQGKGWLIGGSGKGSFDAIKIAKSIAKKIPKNKNFEIHVEYDKNGRYTVWYRMV